VVPGGSGEKDSGCYYDFFFSIQGHKISLFISFYFSCYFLFSSLILVSLVLSSFLYIFYVSLIFSRFFLLFFVFFLLHPPTLPSEGVYYKRKRGRESPYPYAVSLNE
jgi:hypothetical protein